MKKNIKLIILGITILVIIIYCVIKNLKGSKIIIENICETNIEGESNNNNEEIIIVHIDGAVHHKGLIKIKKGARLLNLIEAAGGLTDEADVSKINLAYIVRRCTKDIYTKC